MKDENLNETNEATFDFSRFFDEVLADRALTDADEPQARTRAPEALRVRQHQFELQGTAEALASIKAEVLSVSEQAYLLKKILGKLTAAIERHQAPSGKAGRKKKSVATYGNLAADVIALITLRVMFAAVADGDRPIQKVADEVGQLLDAEKALQDKAANDKTGYDALLKRIREKTRNKRVRLERLIEAIADDDHERMAAGAPFVQLALHATDLFKTQPKDTRSKGFSGKVDVLILSLEGEGHLFTLRHQEEKWLRPDNLPMICPPREWTGLSQGGYLSIPHPAIKIYPITTWSAEQMKRLETDPPKALLETLNHLQCTGWCLDTGVLHGMADILRRPNYKPAPKKKGAKSKPKPVPSPDFETRSDETIGSDVAELKFREWLPALRSNLRRAPAYHRRGEPFYFVWQADFRGRCYPVCETLSPQGHDSALALLRFAEAKPLGHHGEKWLALHGSNVLDPPELKGRPIDERIDWVHSHTADICAAARAPFDNINLLGGDPSSINAFSKTTWRALGFCQEWARLQDVGLARFTSSLPVAVDGTCNAIQHLAALTRCEVLGAKVNLMQQSECRIKQDIYQVVADRMLAGITDELAGNAPAEDDLEEGRQLLSCIDGGPASVATRNLCKVPMMTRPYGLSDSGLRQEIWDWLREDAKAVRAKDLPDHVYKGGAKFLFRHLDSAIKSELGRAQALMKWMQKCARLVTKLNEPIGWETYLGLPVLQINPELKPRKEINVNIDVAITPSSKSKKKRRSLSFRAFKNKISSNEAANGIVANLVHSQDAAHMMMVTREAKAAGINSLRMVHDSFATHAGDMEQFSRIIRETFVELYTKDDAIERFHQRCKKQLETNPKLLKRFENEAAIPDLGSLDITQVLKSEFFFS